MENITEAAAREIHLAGDNSHCGADACGEAAAVAIGDRRLCVEHFVPVCMQEVESRSDWLKKTPYDASATDAFKKFIAACIEQARNLVDDERVADGHTKSRVQEFLRRISQTALRLRRSPRLSSSVPIILRREDSGRTWEEETWTISVSLHGASLVCRHPVETGGSLVLSRRDRANRVQARVVYCRYNSEGWREIGVELLDRDDFWGLAQATAV
jgi:PilZ domain